MRIQVALVAVLLAGGSLGAQPALSRVEGPPLFTSALPQEEFAARRAKVLQQIGDAVVVMQGATETSSYEKFRQSNQFFYLTGIEVPRTGYENMSAFVPVDADGIEKLMAEPGIAQAGRKTVTSSR